MADMTISKTREIIEDFSIEIEKRKEPCKDPSERVINFRREQVDKIPRPVFYVPIDLLRYRKDNGRIADALFNSSLENLDDGTVAFLRRKKAEETYHEWMKELKQSYRIEINQDLWAKITDL